MKILALVKRVTDYEAKLKIKSDGSFIETDDVNMIMNPFDEISVEEALRLKEQHGGEVIILSIGPEEATQQIRNALAMGADRGILILHDTYKKFLDSGMIAKIIKKIYEMEKPDIILMGKQSIDDDNHQVGEYLAEMVNMAQASQANKVTVDMDNKVVFVDKEVDGGVEKISMELPCLITADLRLNEPRYASLPGIMKAKRKKIKKLELSNLDIKIENNIIIEKLELPKVREAGVIVEDVLQLVDKLHNEAKII